MKLEEVIKSGRFVRRKGWGWYEDPDSITYSLKDVISDDWEVEGVRLNLSEENVMKALRDTFDLNKLESGDVERLLGCLGFK